MLKELRMSVVICTRNRAVSLARALTSLCDLACLPSTSWEVLVVNNGSDDETSEVIKRFDTRLPIREESEEIPGLSHARNRAITSVTGDYIIWTDDDVKVDRNWLIAYAEAFARWPDAAVFGGKILPVLEEPVPAWFGDNLDTLAGLLAFRDFGNAPLPLSIADERIPFGANYAVRTAEQREFLYNPALGVGPGQSRLGEETTVLLSILKTGKSGRWVPGSVVYHQIPRSRLTLDYVSAYYRAVGETDAYLGPGPAGPMWAGAPRWLWRRVVTRMTRYYSARLLLQPSAVWLRHFTQVSADLGALHFWRSDARHEANHQ